MAKAPPSIDALRRRCPYATYRASGIDWLGDVPAHWEVKRLKFLTSGRTRKLDSRPHGSVYVGLEHVESWTGRLVLEDQPESVDSVVSSFAAGDLLFGKLRPYLAKVACPDFNGVCTSELLALTPASGCVKDYLMYCLLNQSFVHWLDSLTYGAKMPRVSPDQFGDSYAPLPPKAEQHAIVDFLDRETAKVDALVAKKERLIKLLLEKRAAFIGRGVTRGLEPSVPMTEDSGAGWPSETPVHWQVKKLGYATSIGNGSTPNRDEFRYWNEGIHPWLTSAKVNEGTITAADEFVTDTALDECHLPFVPAGSALVAITGEGQTRGRAALLTIDATISQHLAYLTPTREIDARFLVRLIEASYEWLREESSAAGSTRAALTCEFLRSLRFALPPVEEQRQIAATIDREAMRIDALVDKVEVAISHLRELRATLISAAVTGKIDIREEAS